MPALKTIKRKLQAPGSYREALIELGKLRSLLEVLQLRNGDTILFKLGEHDRMTNEMIRTFLDVTSERGLRDVNALLLKPGDSVETIGLGAFDQLARSRGYVPQSEVSGDGGSLLRAGNEEQPDSGSPERDGQGQAEGVRAEEQAPAFFSPEEVEAALEKPEFWQGFVTPVIERGGKYAEVKDGVR